jgi:NAD(P)H-nitrite reductase large subunit
VTGLHNIFISGVESIFGTYSNRQRTAQGDDPSFVRVLLLRGRMVGAALIGETGLEETFENLILDQLDLAGLGPALMDPDVELDHVFD